MNKKLILISLDALSNTDYKDFSVLPQFKRLLEEGIHIKNMQTIYPSVTYPAHTTIVSGRYPKSHGIINNHRFNTELNKNNWYWYEPAIKGDTIFRSAKRKKLKVGTFLWPVTAQAKWDIYLPEILPYKPWHNKVIQFLYNASLFSSISYEKKYGKRLKGNSQPQLDSFVEGCALDALKNKDLDVLAIHYTELDTFKHNYGIESDERKIAIKDLDIKLKHIFDDLDAKQAWDHTNVVIVSDHGQFNVSETIFLNSYLADIGQITCDKDNKVKDYTMLAHSCGGSSYVYIKDWEKIDEYKKILEAYQAEHPNEIEAIYTQEELIKLGADPKAAFMLEAANTHTFEDNIHPKNYIKSHKGDHGFLPDKPDYGAIFFAMGPDFKKGYLKEKDHVINIAPTIAHIMNLDLQGPDGSIIEDILI